MAQESVNIVNLTGKVAEIEVRTGFTKKNVAYIGGRIKIETGEDNIIPVSFFAQETTSKGKQNPVYKSLFTVAEGYKSIAQHGREEADTVELTGGRLEENIYFPSEDKMFRGFQIGGTFFKRNNMAQTKNDFVITGEILEVIEEIKKKDGDDVPTGAVIVRLLVIGWGDKGNVIDFIAEEPSAAQYIKASFSQDMEVKLSGKIVIDETTETITEPVAFGEPLERAITRTERKLVIKSATAPISTTLPTEDKAKILATREADIQEKKEAAGKKTQAAPKSDFTL